jgi:hypothetical protein
MNLPHRRALAKPRSVEMKRSSIGTMSLAGSPISRRVGRSVVTAAALSSGGRFGEWAIDRLVEKIVPEDIVALFTDEAARNAAVYEDVSPVLGIEINQPCELGDGVRLVPPAADIFSGFDYPWSDPGTRNETPALGCAVRRRASSHATGPCPGARPERHLREASGRYPLLNRSLFVLWFRFRHLSEGGDYGTEDRASGAGELFLCAAA